MGNQRISLRNPDYTFVEDLAKREDCSARDILYLGRKKGLKIAVLIDNLPLECGNFDHSIPEHSIILESKMIRNYSGHLYIQQQFLSRLEKYGKVVRPVFYTNEFQEVHVYGKQQVEEITVTIDQLIIIKSDWDNFILTDSFQETTDVRNKRIIKEAFDLLYQYRLKHGTFPQNARRFSEMVKEKLPDLDILPSSIKRIISDNQLNPYGNYRDMKREIEQKIIQLGK